MPRRPYCVWNRNSFGDWFLDFLHDLALANRHLLADSLVIAARDRAFGKAVHELVNIGVICVEQFIRRP